MANKAKVNLKSAGLRKSEHLYRSLTVIRGSVLTPPENKGEVRGGNSQLASERQLGKIIGQKDLDPTRYGDWERKGRCIDF